MDNDPKGRTAARSTKVGGEPHGRDTLADMRDPREATGTSADTARLRLAAIAVPASFFVVLAGVTWVAAPGAATNRLLLILVNGLILAVFAGLGLLIVARCRQ